MSGEETGLSACCAEAAGRYLRRHRDVATCDRCGMLLLAYGNERDFDETRLALTEQAVRFATTRRGDLRIIAKPRARPVPPRGGKAAR